MPLPLLTILWLEVSVRDVQCMKVDQCIGNLNHVLQVPFAIISKRDSHTQMMCEIVLPMQSDARSDAFSLEAVGTSHRLKHTPAPYKRARYRGNSHTALGYLDVCKGK